MKKGKVPNITIDKTNFDWKQAQNILAFLYPKNKIITAGANESETDEEILSFFLDRSTPYLFSNRARLKEYMHNYNENGLCFTTNILYATEMYRDDV